MNFTLSNSVTFNTTAFHLEADGNINVAHALTVNQSNNDQAEGLEISLLAGGTIRIGGDLHLTTDASNIDTGGNILVMSGGNTTIDSAFVLRTLGLGGTSTGTGGNITVDIGGNLTVGDLAFTVEYNGPNVSVLNGANITLNIDGNLTTTGVNDVNATIDNSGGGSIGTGGNIIFNLGGDVSGGALTLLVDNSAGGHIGAGGNLSFTTGGDLTVDSVDALINNRNGGSISSGANMTFNIGGALTTTGDASFITSNRNDGNGGGTMGANVVLTLQVANVSVGGFFITDISTNGGGNIPNATLNVNIAGNLVATGGAEIDIQNTGFNVFGGPFIGGATIGTDAKVNVSAGSISTGDALDVEIDNNGAGHIGRDALIGVTVSNDINSQSDMFFDIINQATNGAPAGFIGGGAAVSVTAANISSGGFLESVINNARGGHIVGDAAVIFDASGEISAPAGADFEIFNVTGVIGSNATMNVSAASISAENSFLAQLSNYTGGSIGRNALITFTLSGNLSTQGDATFAIDSGFGGGLGTIGGNSTIFVSAANLTSGGSLQAFIGNYASSEIGGNALIDFILSGNLTIQGDATFSIDSGFGGGMGTIGGRAQIVVHAANLNADSSFSASLFNYDGAQIGQNAIITFNLSGDINAQADANFEIFNTNTSGNGSGGTIGGFALINLAAGNLTSGTFFPQIENQFGGTIGSNATITVNVASILSTASDGLFGVSISNFDGGNIGGSALINAAVSGDISAPNEVEFSILNNDVSGGGGGMIASNATINVSANNISTAGVLFAQIRNDGGGSIGGNATINMNVSGTADVASDATFEILGSDDASAATINFNDGSYDAGGTFLAFIDGNGTIAFNNTSVHADVLKVGVFGANGVLNIGGGTLSADTTLKLYASGSSGQLNFIPTSHSAATARKFSRLIRSRFSTALSLLSVTSPTKIQPTVYTNHAHYTTDFGGNGSTTGTFAGSGANDPLPLDEAPDFDDDPRPANPSASPRPESPPRPASRTPISHARPSAGPHVTSADRHHGDVRTGSSNPTRTSSM